MTSSPYATGGGGVDFETEVVAYYLAAALTRAVARGLPDAMVHTVSVQAAGRGEPLDDVVVRGERADGSAKLSLQVKRNFAFTENDGEFPDIVHRAWLTVADPGFRIGIDGAGVAIGVYQQAVDEHYQRVLSWARTATDGAEFLERIGTDGVSHERQRSFVRTMRSLLTRSLARPATDDEVWRLCRAFVILHFDFQNEGSRDTVLTDLVLRRAVEDAHRAVDVRRELVAVAQEWKRSAGTANTESLRARVGGRFAPKETEWELDRRALRLLDDGSRAAAAEVAVVEAGVRSVRLDTGLYVERDIEPRLRAQIESGTAAHLLEGEAGQGKTTLLWQLWRTLSTSPARAVWLVKPARLFGTPPALTATDFERAIRAAREEGREPLALFDTVDVLLHDEATSDRITDLLAALQRAGCAVVVSTRPAEAPLLRHAGIRFSDAFLGNYNERSGELERAIRAHVHGFYDDPDPARDAAQVRRILGSVAAGLPLRQVSLNPLTLRMLFVLYAPASIPDEINVVELFREYWTRRVVTDTRPGSRNPEALDLSRAAEGIALTMLMEGTPEVEERAAQAMLEKLSVRTSDVAELAARGVVQHSGSKIAFFHQTFFEHAAARMLLRLADANGIAALLERVLGRAYDPFLGPVLEQALLLAPPNPLLRDAADDALLRLLRSDDIAVLRAGLGVYVMRDTVPQAATKRVHELIRGGSHEAAVISLLNAAANSPAGRAAELLDLVILAWQIGSSWRVHQKSFVLLERLAGRLGGAVRDCLERIGAVDYALTEALSLQPESELRDVLRALAPHEPAWTWNAIVRLYASADERSDGLRVKMLRLLGERATAFGERGIATRFEHLVERSEPDSDRNDRRDFHDGWARLWSIEWAAAGMPLREILDGIPPDLRRARGRLLALRERLRSATVEEVRLAWRHFLSDPDRARQALATVTLWTPFLSGEAPAALCGEVRGLFREALMTSLEGDHPHAASLRKTLIDAVSRADTNATAIPQIFSAPEVAQAEPWLRVDRLARVIGAAYLAGHEGAVKAVAMVAADPAAYPKVAELLLRKLGEVELTGETSKLFLRLAESVGPSLTIAAAEGLGDAPLTVLGTPQFLDAIARWRNDRSGNTRKDATRLLALLITRGAVAPPPFDEVAGWLAAERDPVHLGHLAMLMGLAARPGGYDLGRLIETLRPYAFGHEQTRTNALDGLLAAVVGSPATTEHLEILLDVIAQEPTDQGRLKHARELLLQLVAIDPRRAVKRLRDFFAIPAMQTLGVNARRDLRSQLETPARTIIGAATDEERVALVEMLPDMDRFLSPIVVRPLTDLAYGEVAEALQRVLPKTNPDVQLLIRQSAKKQQRVFGSGRWADVARLVLPHQG